MCTMVNLPSCTNIPILSRNKYSGYNVYIIYFDELSLNYCGQQSMRIYLQVVAHLNRETPHQMISMSLSRLTRSNVQL